ncbi:flagellar hook assembly protein FlgD [Zooshikella marina]|uniref:Basal-body rod modification protein FlgD n=1 Tax=Zooshikella ganghwensis TaxID=202772 RepID=A0A4V1INC4_9GAMM|nr:flagellar hook assembly protein FlgD [Zooshikella ganghwensis]MBU2704574.1 flagellar hook assembly protein FlgD [Zooshikella ganghwensis]RDH43241.1 flagellar hook assembly protein FlgD [Zooshikella ganghwensis]
MSTINQTQNTTANAVVDKYTLENPSSAKGNKELGQDQFLTLMIEQLKNQDPLNPQKNEDFIAQLAQFSTVEGITNLNQTVTSMSSAFTSSQALQASALVGRSVLVQTSRTQLNAGSDVQGVVDLPASSPVRVDVFNSSGVLVRQIDLGLQPAGAVDFTWDGKDSNGQAMPSGVYSFRASGVLDNQGIALSTMMSTNVDSVTLGTFNDLTLNLAGVGSVKLSDVKRIL